MNDIASEAALLETSRIQREYALARECVRRSIGHDRQVEFHGWQLNQDQVDYLRDCAAVERVAAREHIAAAKLAGARRS